MRSKKVERVQRNTLIDISTFQIVLISKSTFCSSNTSLNFIFLFEKISFRSKRLRRNIVPLWFNHSCRTITLTLKAYVYESLFISFIHWLYSHWKIIFGLQRRPARQVRRGGRETGVWSAGPGRWTALSAIWSYCKLIIRTFQVRMPLQKNALVNWGLLEKVVFL